MAHEIGIKQIEYTYDGHRNTAQLSNYPDTCPVCRKKIQAEFIKAVRKNERFSAGSILQVVFQCPSDDCGYLFVAYYSNSDIRTCGDYYVFRKLGLPIAYKKIDISESINKISPEFESLYIQAATADDAGLDKICGMGYRKALEFLIKDYLAYKKPENRENIIKEIHLQKLIDIIDNKGLKECSKRAQWLGNDEAHYYRKWNNKDIADLKKLLQVTIYWVEADIITEEIQSDMPEK